MVVPVLNEVQRIGELLEPLQSLRGPQLEIIIADGGSDDGTGDAARPLCDAVICAPPGRASQMNAGAAHAQHQVLVFVHADTRFEADHLAALIRHAPQMRWGRFDVHLDGRPRMLRVIAAMMNWRSRLTGIATGDQVIFVQREDFDAVGGYPPIALMEDIAISAMLRARAWPTCIRAPLLQTSGRRWERHGVWRTIALMWTLRLGFALGVSPDRLNRAYRRQDQ
jgi:rSAM/selenodomain-associated transferase 2